MKKIFFTLLLLTGCTPSRQPTLALVNVTCYDKEGMITLAWKETRGSVEIVDDPSRHYRSQKCIIERVE